MLGSPPQRILVRGVNWLGDAVMTTPALLRLRERFPDATITLLTPEKLRELWLHHTAVDEVIPFRAGEGVLSTSRKLRERKFDLALVLPNSPRSALEVWLARIPRRVGYSRSWRNYFLTIRVPPRRGAVEMRKRSTAEIHSLIAGNASPGPRDVQYPIAAHHVHHYLQLAAALDANPDPLPPRLFVTPLELAAVGRKFGLDAVSTGGRPLLALNPGAEYGPAKRWPAHHFIATAREVQRRTHCLWIILGGKRDADIAHTIAAGLTPSGSHPVLNLAGQTTLRELMALLKLCRVVLTNDTGPMHVAAALGTSVVVPFGSTAPELTGPGLPADAIHRLLKSDAPCSPCFRRECPIDLRCMNGIAVEGVVAAVMEMM